MRVSTRVIFADLAVDQALDLAQLFAADRLEVGEIETQPLGAHQRTALLHMLTEHLSQRRVQQMGCGVMQRDGATADRVHRAHRPDHPPAARRC